MGASQSLGRWGEEQAAAYLRERGWEILAQRCRCGPDELDLIAQNGEFVIFVEVKTRRPGALDSGWEAVGPKKQAHLLRAAALWLSCHPQYAQLQPRMDVVQVEAEPGPPPRLRTLCHLPNAFGE